MAGRKPKPAAIKELEGNPGGGRAGRMLLLSLEHIRCLLMRRLWWRSIRDMKCMTGMVSRVILRWQRVALEMA